MRFLLPLKGSLQNPTYSPDGKSLLVTRYRQGYDGGASDLYTIEIMDREKGVRQVTSGFLNGCQNVSQPGYLSSWTSQGWIALTTNLGASTWPAKIRPDGSEFTWLLDREKFSHQRSCYGLAPTFAPDGETFAYVHCSDSCSKVNALMIARGNDVERAVYPGPTENCYVESPQWSPDGKSISFDLVKFDDGSRAIAIYDIASDSYRRITTGRTRLRGATWAPDSQSVVASGLAGLYEVPAVASTLPQVATKLHGHEGDRVRYLAAASWSPDARAKRRRLVCHVLGRETPSNGGPGTLIEIF